MSIKQVKKAISVFLALAILFAGVPAFGTDLFSSFTMKAQAASGTCGTNATWEYNETTKTLTISGTGKMEDYEGESHMPWSSLIETIVIENGITSIGNGAFSWCEWLTNVVIPDSVTSIGNFAFYNCIRLTGLTIPTSVERIGEGTFFNCGSLTNITIPNGITKIETNTFSGCAGLTSVTIPDSVTSIGYSAFNGCTGLTSVTIPDSVTSIGSNAFENVPNVIYHGSASGSPWGARAVNGYIEESLVYADENKTTLLACPSSYQGSASISNSVVSIGDCAFYHCSGLTSVTIPDSVTSIGNYAFSGCTGLASVTIPDSVTSIGGSAFDGCTELTSVTVPASVTSIGSFAFSYCTGLTRITVETNNPNYSSDSNGVLYNKNKTELIQYPIGNQRASFAVPDSVTIICNGAFNRCASLTSVTIGSSVESIGSAFSDCTGLTNVTIPNSVTNISGGAFYGCQSLTDVYYAGTRSNWKAITIDFSFNQPLENARIHYTGDPLTLTVKTTPTKTTYSVGETFDQSGLTLTATYTDNIEDIITSGFTCSDPDMSTPGVKTVTVSYEGKTATFTITVNPAPTQPRVIKVELSNVSINYKASAALKPTITADDGAEYTVKYESSNPDTVSVNEKTGEIYGAKKGTATIKVTVTDNTGKTVTATCKVTVKYAVWQWLIIYVLFGWIWYK